MPRDSIRDYSLSIEEVSRIQSAISRTILEDAKAAKYLRGINCVNMALALENDIRASERLLQLIKGEII